jgi:hypothetical protein
MNYFMTFFLMGSLIGSAWAQGGRVRSAYLDDQKIEQITVRPGKLTALHFPVKPENSALGMKGTFDLTYIGNDIVIGALRPLASTNLLVYLMGRRFTFELASHSDGLFDEIVNVFDSDSVRPQASLTPTKKGKKSKAPSQPIEVLHE